MINCETVAQEFIDIEMECPNENSVEILEADESFDELVRVFRKKYIHEVLEVDTAEENLEELDVFEENFVDADIVHEISNVEELLLCQ